MSKTIIHYLKQLLTIDEQLAPFTILDLEKEVDRTLTYTTHEGTRTICVGGFIDRLDRITDQEGERIRVIDYKTGKLPQMKTNGIDDIFDIHNRQKRHADYYLQTFLYALNVRNSSDFMSVGGWTRAVASSRMLLSIPVVMRILFWLETATIMSNSLSTR